MRPERHPQPLEVIGGVQRGDFPLPGFQGCPLIPENTPRAGGWEERRGCFAAGILRSSWRPDPLLRKSGLRSRQRQHERGGRETRRCAQPERRRLPNHVPQHARDHARR